MNCWHCGDAIKGKARYVTVAGEQVPFCPNPSLIKDCVNEHLKGEHQSDDTYVLGHVLATVAQL